MSDYCNICETRRPEGGTQHLVLNDGKLWLEYCKTCGENETLTNAETGETKTIAELASLAKIEPEASCEFCGSDDIGIGGLCHTCATDHYA